MDSTFLSHGAIFISALLGLLGAWASPKGTLKRFLAFSALCKNGRLLLISLVMEIVVKLSTVLLFAYEILPSESGRADISNLLKIGPLGWFAAILIGSMIIPFSEELLFRGYVFQALSSKPMTISRGAAVLLSSMLFAVSHPDAWADKFISGLIYSNLTIRQNSLIPSIALHALINLLALTMMTALMSMS